MMRTSFKIMVGVLLALLVSACASRSRMSMSPAKDASYGGVQEESDSAFGGDAADMAAPVMYAEATGTRSSDDSGAPAPPPPPPQAPPMVSDGQPPMVPAPAPPATSTQRRAVPLLIYTAQMNMAVFEATASIEAVQKLALDSGGYLVRRTDRSITVRVPAEKFRPSIVAIGKMGDVLHRDETVQDVTDQFYDLRTRLKNARAVRERLQQLLAQSKDVKDALAVEKELGRVTADIESMEGKLKRLGELIAFSTITVDFRPRAVDQVNSKVKLPFPWLNRLGLSNLLSL